MAEDEARRITAQDEETEEVEAHSRRITADDDAESTEGDDDFEAHAGRRVQQRRTS